MRRGHGCSGVRIVLTRICKSRIFPPLSGGRSSASPSRQSFPAAGPVSPFPHTDPDSRKTFVVAFVATGFSRTTTVRIRLKPVTTNFSWPDPNR